MRCEDLVSIINDYLEGDMSPKLMAELDRHMEDCASCLAFFETYKKTKELTSEIICDDIPDAVQERLRSFLRKKLASS